jgi:hypothetical protein
MKFIIRVLAAIGALSILLFLLGIGYTFLEMSGKNAILMKSYRTYTLGCPAINYPKDALGAPLPFDQLEANIDQVATDPNIKIVRLHVGPVQLPPEQFDALKNVVQTLKLKRKFVIVSMDFDCGTKVTMPPPPSIQ